MSNTTPAAAASRLRLVIILGALTAFAPLSIDMYLPAFPAIEADFAATPAAVQATLATFFIGLAVGQGLYGPIADRFGRRVPLVAGISVYVLASILAAFAPSIEALTMARLAQALGGCAGVVIARAMVRDLFHEREAARVYSQLMLVMGVAPILAPVLGAYVLEIADWTAMFWLLGGFGALCIAAVIFGLPETLPPDRRTRDGVGGALLGYAALCRDRPFMGFALCSACASASLFAYITASPFVFLSLHGVSTGTYSILFGTNAFGLILSSQVNAVLLRRFTARQILKIAGVGNAVAGMALVAATILAPGWFAGLVVPLLLFVGSLGFIFPNAVATAMSGAGARAGGASALIGMLQFVMGAVAAAVVGLFGEDSAAPMALVMCAASLAGLLSGRAGVRAALRHGR